MSLEPYTAEFWLTYSDIFQQTVELNQRPGSLRLHQDPEQRAVFELSVTDETGRVRRPRTFKVNGDAIVCEVSGFSLTDQVRVTFRGLTSVGYGKKTDWVMHARLTSGLSVLTCRTRLKVLTHIRGPKRRRLASGDPTSPLSGSETEASSQFPSIEQQLQQMRRQALQEADQEINSLRVRIQELEEKKATQTIMFDNLLKMVHMKQEYC